MSNNKSIQFLRSTNITPESNNASFIDILPGQPFWDMQNHKLYIGENRFSSLAQLEDIASMNLDRLTGGVSTKKRMWYENNIIYSSGEKGSQQGDIIPGAVASGFMSTALGGLRYDYYTNDTTLENNIGIDPSNEQHFGRTPTSAEGIQSFASGGSTHAYGDWSTAIGKDVKSYQRASLAIGGGCKAGRTEEEFNDYFWNNSTNSAINGGKGKDASGNILDSSGKTYPNSYSYATSFGEMNNAYGRNAFAAGMSNNVSDYGFAVGKYLNAEYEQFVIGKYNDSGFTNSDATKTVFAIGNGTSDDNRSNLFEITRWGAVKLGNNNTLSSQYNKGCVLIGSNIVSHNDENFGYYLGQDLTSNIRCFRPHLVIGQGSPQQSEEDYSNGYFYSLSIYNGGNEAKFGVQPNGKIRANCVEFYGQETSKFAGGLVVSGSTNLDGVTTIEKTTTINGYTTINANLDNSNGYFSTKGITIKPDTSCQLNLGSNGNGASSISSFSDSGLYIKSFIQGDSYQSCTLNLMSSNINTDSDSLTVNVNDKIELRSSDIELRSTDIELSAWNTTIYNMSDLSITGTNISNFNVKVQSTFSEPVSINNNLETTSTTVFKGATSCTITPKNDNDIVRLVDLGSYVKVEAKDDWILCGGQTGGSGSSYQAGYNNNFVLSTDPDAYNWQMWLTTHTSVTVTLNKSYNITNVYTGGYNSTTTTFTGPTVSSWQVSDNKLTINYSRSPKSDDDFYIRIQYMETNYDIGGVGGGCSCPDIKIVASSPSSPVDNTIYLITA